MAKIDKDCQSLSKNDNLCHRSVKKGPSAGGKQPPAPPDSDRICDIHAPVCDSHARICDTHAPVSDTHARICDVGPGLQPVERLIPMLTGCSQNRLNWSRPGATARNSAASASRRRTK